jgi:acyl-ACP thioesterase
MFGDIASFVYNFDMEKDVYKMQITFSKDDFCGKNIMPNVIFNRFEKIAMAHANLLGIGYDEMFKKNLLWVAIRIKYKVDKLPSAGETLELSTFPHSKNVLEFDRDFLIENSSGETLIRGTSKWCFIDKTTRRLAKMTSVVLPCELSKRSVFEEKFLKTELLCPNFAPDYSHKVVPDDIDINGHMNNSVYAKLVFDCLNLSNFEQIDTFQLNFLHEARLGDRIDVFKQKEEAGHNILGKLCERENCFSALVKTKK